MSVDDLKAPNAYGITRSLVLAIMLKRAKEARPKLTVGVGSSAEPRSRVCQNISLLNNTYVVLSLLQLTRLEKRWHSRRRSRSILIYSCLFWPYVLFTFCKFVVEVAAVQINFVIVLFVF